MGVMTTTQETKEQNEVVPSLFDKLRSERFFGVVEFHCMNGHVVRIKKTESFEPKEFDRLRHSSLVAK